MDAAGLIRKYRAKGVFIDTNLLVLLLVGLVNPARILTFKRTQAFTIPDFRLLQRLIAWFGRPIVATPHVLSQLSDLTHLPEHEVTAARDLFKMLVEEIEEQYDPARKLVTHRLFHRFGLSDASIAAVCQRNVLVLTADVQLQIALASSGLDALNFTHIRPLKF
jgi:hypothetical protein